MGYLRAGFIVLAVLGGIAGAVAATVAPAAAAPLTSPAAAVSAAPRLSPGAAGSTTPATTPPPTPAPSSVSQMPALTQQPDGSWVTTIYVNSAALSPKPPTYALVTTNPNAAIPNTASGGKAAASGPCANASSGTAPGLTQVCLIFTPVPGQLPVAPVSAAVVMTPATGGAPVSVTVSVHRLVTAWQYLYIPVICGAALAVLLIGGMFAFGLPDPSWPSDNGRRRRPRADGRPEKLRWMRLWRLQIYAGSAWSFSGSWATNVTTVATLAGTVITATGAVSELLPGVEAGRFSLLLALTGGITLAAPLAWRPGQARLGAGGAGGGSALPGDARHQRHRLSAGMAVTVDPWVVVDVKDTNLAAKAADSSHASFLARAVTRAIGRQDTAKGPASADSGHVTYAVPAARPIVLAGDAKLSVLGAASLGLPAGTVIASPRPAQHEARGATPRSPSRASSLTDWTVYPLPHSGEQVASRMSSLLLASCLTLFGTGAATGILGVLAFCLSTANLAIRSCCIVFLAATALGVWWYSTKSFMALADPTPGDSLSTADDSSFLL